MLPLLALTAMSQTQPYSEPLRPQFHFTAQSGWLNDPNGLVFYKGEYHLFFQHNPFGTQWGNMTWGHAVSPDLVHWKQLDEAIKPDSLGTIFSGSAVVDAQNTAGLGKDAMVCIYTAAGGTSDLSKGQPFTQCIASSNDGRHFAKSIGNPVLPHIEAENRDPKVLWHEPTHCWVMALYLDADRYAFFGSPDLKSWTKLSGVELPDASECPDLFPMKLDGKTRWVFWGGNGRYRVGDFDGAEFKPETDSIPSNFGNTGYAAQTYFNDPKGRRIQIAWFNNSNFPDVAWNQQMGFPTELRLVSTPAGPRLTFQPVDEIKTLRAGQISQTADHFFPSAYGLMDIELKATTPKRGTLKLTLNGQVLAFDAASRELSVAGKVAHLPDPAEIDLRILVDRASIEIFAQGGLVSMPIFGLPTSAPQGVRIETPADWKIQRLNVFRLSSAWR